MIDAALIVVAAIVAIALATAIAPKLNIAGPLILVIVGLAVSLLPFVPAIELDPELILIGVLPPLLYSAAVQLPAIEFRRDGGPIAGLAVLLVVVSALVLAFFFQAVIPGLDFMLALALGAILSPTDAVATSIVKRLGISRRVVTMLEGESLLNDATSLVILRTAVAAAALGAASDEEPPGFVGAFVWGVVVAVLVGAVVGFINLRLRAVIRHSGANTALSFVVPFVAYIPTEHLGGSGLVAAVVAGIVTGQGAQHWFTPEQRMSDNLNWRTIELMLEGAVFLIMGLELKEIVRQNNETEAGVWHGLWLAAAALGIVLAVRAVYVALLVWLQSRRARDRQRARLNEMNERLDQMSSVPPDAVIEKSRRRPGMPRDPQQVARRLASMRSRVSRALADLDYYAASPLGWKHGTIIVWAGMRGVVTLAAAQTLPRETPERALLVFTAFLVAVGSLMLQGFTLPWLVRLLKIDSPDEALQRVEQDLLDTELRVAAAAALENAEVKRRDGSPFDPEFVQAVGARLTQRPDDDDDGLAKDVLELRLALLHAQRRRLNELSSGGTFSTPALRHALAELDADELSLELRLDDAS